MYNTNNASQLDVVAQYAQLFTESSQHPRYTFEGRYVPIVRARVIASGLEASSWSATEKILVQRFFLET
ncbi:hypothetical protein TNCV_1247111 [Trichonephila clavipes]|uniref:Uncharacterized protein n=1 Tax=Trichonephila clavipes TaxID=2585209 RepID=A0A8X6RGN5_TRICX|nr:hypothetical protein TNCV_1247111 [Trichonephila clavipes]